jgi:hypothetical protein
MNINHLAVEVTRRCNIQCKHCVRGHAQNIDIPLEYIDTLLDQVTSINHFSPTGGEPSLNVPAIKHFIKGCKDRRIPINKFYISTNGINIKNDFVDVCLELYDMCTMKDCCRVQISNDKYHLQEKHYDDSLLSPLPFYGKRGRENSDMPGGILIQGLAENLKEATVVCRKGKVIDCYYLTARGNVIHGDCWSYKNERNHVLCRVNSLKRFIETKKMIEEDFERLSILDKMYLLEREREIANEWMQWEDEQEKKKNEIVMEAVIYLKEETYDRERQRVSRKGVIF